LSDVSEAYDRVSDLSSVLAMPSFSWSGLSLIIVPLQNGFRTVYGKTKRPSDCSVVDVAKPDIPGRHMNCECRTSRDQFFLFKFQNQLRKPGGNWLPMHRRDMPTKVKTTNAIAMLKEDHEKVKELFEKFEKANGSATKAKIANDALMELKVHATVEEELFYPAVRQQIEDGQGIMDEADEEHHVARVLIAELEKMRGDEDHWEAKFKVLAESVRHHIKEEEAKMFKEAKKTGI
jgi:hypothetical protein